MRRIPNDKQGEIIALRRKGMSIPEISRATNTAKTTVQRYVLGVEIPQMLLKKLKERQGGSASRASALRENRMDDVTALLGSLSQRDYFMLLIGIYWGEGTKRDLSVINSDPSLLQTFLWCLKLHGISNERISLSLRIHSDIKAAAAVSFWSKTLALPRESISRIEIIEGKKKGKLPYGMCRIRVRKGIRDRLLIQSAISVIGKECSEKVVSG
ncbi:MAG TPA: hypothetical protein PK609_03765 [Candidatus Paceibacterota bacterium]|nr:hypothetical protein [Candidatus Paceibacterota bacterium]